MTKRAVSGHEKILARMRRVREGLPTVMRDAGIDRFLLTRIRRNFDAGVDPNGNKWKPLASSTVQRKREKGIANPEKPLVESGSLRASIAVIVGRADGIYAMNTGLGFRIGVDDEDASAYARIQNFGGWSGKPLHYTPARRFLGLGEKDVKAVRGFVARRMAALINTSL